MINDDGLIKEKLNLADLDPIFATSFRQMITESFAEGKHFFLAKIVNKNMTKGAANEGDADGLNHSHFFNAYSILKLLFKKKES